MKNNNTIEFSDKLLLSQAKIISAGIASEADHMIAKNPEELHREFMNCGGLSALVNGKIAGLIKLSELDKNLGIFERGGLFVLPEYRKHGIGRELIERINREFHHRAILSVTNVPAVKRINGADSNQKFVGRSELGELLPIIEGPQPLLPDDDVFVNNALYERIKRGEFNSKS